MLSLLKVKGKPELNTRRELQGRTLEGKEEHTLIDRRCLFVFYAEHNNKIERGLLGT